jgi:hypothetical protein
MAAAKPLLYIGDQNSEIDNYVKKYNCGWSFTWENQSRILSFLSTLSLKSLPEIIEKSSKSKFASQDFKKEDILNLF